MVQVRGPYYTGMLLQKRVGTAHLLGTDGVNGPARPQYGLNTPGTGIG